MLSTQMVQARGWRGIVGGREVEVAAAVEREVSEVRSARQELRQPAADDCAGHAQRPRRAARVRRVRRRCRAEREAGRGTEAASGRNRRGRPPRGDRMGGPVRRALTTATRRSKCSWARRAQARRRPSRRSRRRNGLDAAPGCAWCRPTASASAPSSSSASTPTSSARRSPPRARRSISIGRSSRAPGRSSSTPRAVRRRTARRGTSSRC